MVTLWGIIARFINLFISVKPKFWVFGSDYGNTYREGSKYMIEYMLKNHPDYTCYFITRNPSVKELLDQKGIPCLINTSFKGIIAIAKAESIFTTQVLSDILFGYKKRGRLFIYLTHGQPYKKALYALGDDYINKIILNNPGFISKIKSKITKYLNEGVEFKDASFVSVTSEFLAPFFDADFGGFVPIKTLGMPRNDGLFQSDRMSKEKWVPDIEGKFIITYMPTHRFYGKGNLCPIPFEHNLDIQEWMRNNNVVLLVKQHPNMIPKIKDPINSDVIKDITAMGIDPQVCLYYSNVLITDYSSVWIDYLILQRPLIFYYYDNFEQDDQGVFYDIRQDPPGHFCYSEGELFNTIKSIRENYITMCPSKHIINKFHKYPDGNSCERYFNAIVSDLKYEN